MAPPVLSFCVEEALVEQLDQLSQPPTATVSTTSNVRWPATSRLSPGIYR